MGKENERTAKKFANITDMLSDEKAEKDGVELAFGNGRFIVVMRSGVANRNYKSVMSRIFKPHQNVTGAVSMTDAAALSLIKEVYAEAVVLDWRGFVDAEGKNIPYSKNNCVDLFTASPQIFEIVQSESAKFSNFARREIEESGK